ncbi:hypothetical protein PGT21_014644 [Puccinia graminis f. sp. tritici]|uniref:Tet-like 2OG-Fe(II) oxygenase domain-containing protein n=1 Tax=Puccinia graminis f. sp. tritici TaxID=56615 RepID=A0A5B0Q2W8_PUCGR|nr:hypothetical protein PGT21_006987 [Puccinia graminis f. sp. tritici]KAA1107459.1 hypothetical protein PGT21_014644 [Puccinia graminis f. sp. tritici]
MARINKRHVNRSSKMANTSNKQRARIQEHARLQEHVIGLHERILKSIRWQRLKYYEDSHLYPTVPWDEDTDHPLRGPTPQEVSNACKLVDSNYFLMKKGRPVLRDPSDHDSIIAIIEFTPWDKLTDAEKEDLDFLSTFLHKSKEFINPVSSSSRSWGGKMWAIGWRKSQDFLQMPDWQDPWRAL